MLRKIILKNVDLAMDGAIIFRAVGYGVVEAEHP